MVWTEECVLPLAAAGVYPKTRVWGSSEKTLHCFSATALLSGNSRRGWENSSGETALGSALDQDGNTLTMVNSSGTTTYSWDFENRLTSVTLPASGGTVTFKYDPFGRRIYKSSSSGTSIYAYDGDNLVEETNSSGSAVARYGQGLNIDEPLAILRSGTISYYQADGVGSLTSLSNTSGAVANTYTYDSFGNLVASSGSLVNNFRYTGREFDTETSLYYYRARYYDPAAGRFIGEDPLGLKAGTDLYSYVSNRPVNFRDSSGFCKVELRFDEGHHHSYIVVTAPNGIQYYYRGGPSSNSSGSSGSSRSSGTSGSGSGSSGGPWGPLVPTVGVYGPHTVDWDPVGALSETLEDDQGSCGCVTNNMGNFTQKVIEANLPYSPWSTNSNAYAYGAAKAAGFTPSPPPIFAPGYNYNLPLP